MCGLRTNSLHVLRDTQRLGFADHFSAEARSPVREAVRQRGRSCRQSSSIGTAADIDPRGADRLVAIERDDVHGVSGIVDRRA